MTRQLFGTDGIRGEAYKNPMTREIAYKLGKAVTRIKNKETKKKVRIVIGRDTRESGVMFEKDIKNGVEEEGGRVILVGVVPTPTTVFLAKELGDAGIMITASHNPYKDNGLKVIGGDGYKLSDAEELRIEEILLDGDTIYSEEVDSQEVFEYQNAQKYKEALLQMYPEKLKGNFNIIIDTANGATSEMAPEVLKALDFKVEQIGGDPDGQNINKVCGSEHPEKLKEEIKKGDYDIGIAFDGDGDRVRIVDENGNEVDGDNIIAACAIYLKERGELKNDTVVVTVMSNLGMKKKLEENGIKIIETKVGDRYVLEEMRKGEYNVGGEQSGHIIFLDHSTTGDGILSALQFIKIMKETGQKASELGEIYKTYPQVLVNVKVKEKRKLEDIPSVQEVIKEVKVKLGDEGRVLVRYSGTEYLCRVMVEGENVEEVKEYVDEIVMAIKEEIGIKE